MTNGIGNKPEEKQKPVLSKRVDQPDSPPDRHRSGAASGHFAITAGTAPCVLPRTSRSLLLPRRLPRKPVANTGAPEPNPPRLHRLSQLWQGGLNRLSNLRMLRNKKSMCMVIGNLEHHL